MSSFPSYNESLPSLFPLNISLAEARASVAGRIDFRETIAHDYVSFIYFLGMAPDMFPDPETAPDESTKRLWQVRRECRGIIFHKDGHILSRRFQKFFNIGELPETHPDRLTIRLPFVLLEKLDGSMIAPFFVEGTLRYCTKSGYTDSSKVVEAYVEKHAQTIPYTAFCTEAIAAGFTPMFEWCSPSGRIVLEYKQESLHLLALRHMITGRYVPFDEMQTLARSRGVPVVKKWELQDLKDGGNGRGAGEERSGYRVLVSTSNIDDESEKHVNGDLRGEALLALHRQIQSQQDVEGLVLQQEDGMMYKIKTLWYFRIHRSTQFMKYYGEKHVWEAILGGTFDDVKAWLPAPVRDAISNFAAELMRRAEHTAREALDMATKGFAEHPQRTDFNANVIAKQKESGMKTLLWKAYAELQRHEKAVEEEEKTKKDGAPTSNDHCESPPSHSPPPPSASQPLSAQMIFEWILEIMLVNTSSPKSLKKNTAFVGDLTYETFRPKNETPHIFNVGEEAEE